MIAVSPRPHRSLIGDLWSVALGSRVRLGVGIYWRGIAIVIDVISALATLGIVAALPPLLMIVAKPIRSVVVGFVVPLITAFPNQCRDRFQNDSVTSSKPCGLRHIATIRGPLRFGLAVLATCLVGLFTLQGCAPELLRAPSPPHTYVTANTPSNIRMMGADHRLTATTAQLQGANLNYSAIPAAYPNLAPFDFSTAAMRSLFQFGFECAHSSRLWISSQREATDRLDHGKPLSGPNIGCPADDGFIAGFAAR